MGVGGVTGELSPFMLQKPVSPLIPSLIPDIKDILPTVLHTFLVELVRRICLNIKTSYPWWSLPLFSSLELLNM